MEKTKTKRERLLTADARKVKKKEEWGRGGQVKPHEDLQHILRIMVFHPKSKRKPLKIQQYLGGKKKKLRLGHV